MKTKLIFLLALFPVGLRAQVPVDSSVATEPVVVGRGANHRTWATVTSVTNEAGDVSFSTNSAFTELASGLHRRDPNQPESWIDSSEQLELVPDKGGAEALKGPYRAFFPASLYEGAIEIEAPEAPGAKHLVCRPLGLSYFDGEKSALIAELQAGPIGQLLPSGNQVIWTNICTGIRIDLLATYRMCGTEVDVIIRERLPDPMELGFPDAKAVSLQWLTEFFDPPQASTSEALLANGLGDVTLDFGGDLIIGQGKAFSLGEESLTGLPVAKEWTVLDGRGPFLVEEIPLEQISDKLNALPLHASSSKANRSSELAFNGAARVLRLPSERPPKASGGRILMAGSGLQREPGVLIDFTTLSGNVTNHVFKTSETTYVSGQVNLSGTTIYEGATVIKFTNQPSAKLSMSGASFVCKTGPYRMAVLTSKNDDSIGDVITGSTHSATNYNGGTYLSEGTGAYKYLRLAYAGVGILGLVDAANGGVWHCQFVRCTTAIRSDDTDIDLHNVLFSNCGTAVDLAYVGDVLRGEHVTADQVNVFFAGADSSNNGKVTNSIFTAVASLGTNVTLYNSVQASSGSGIFQSAVGGNYYLVAGSTNRGAGTTNISGALLSDLREKTIDAPVLFNGVTISVDTTLGPQAQREIGPPSLGYHYDVLDFLMQSVLFTNAALVVQPGTAMGVGGKDGLKLASGSTVTCVGTPNHPNWVVRYNLVQEYTNTSWQSLFGNSVTRDTLSTNGTPPQTSFGFTDWSAFVDSQHFADQALSMTNCFFNCQFHGSRLYFGAPPIALTNNLFDRVQTSVDDSLSKFVLTASLNNCLFFGGWLSLSHYTNDTWTLRNNLFDQTALYQWGSGANEGAYNGYTPGSNRITPTNANDVVASIAYQAGPLGSFYQPTNSAFINKGSTNADLLGLYHYTVCQVKETNSVVDLSFHYVATDGNGTPSDVDLDGWPDYLEDANGNGSLDSGETNWQNASDLGLKVLITRPRNGSVIP